jgi:hypothetical protein
MTSPIPSASTLGKPIPHVLVPTPATASTTAGTNGAAQSAGGGTDHGVPSWSALPVSVDSATVVSALRRVASETGAYVPDLALLSYLSFTDGKPIPHLVHVPQVVLLPSSVAAQPEEIDRLNDILYGQSHGRPLGRVESVLGALPATADTAALLATQTGPELPTPR